MSTRTALSESDRIPSGTDLPQFFTVGEVAEILRVTPPTVRQMIRSGQIPAIEIGRCLRINVQQFQAWLASR